jgi:D-sedoheptulose 7-phosphate isomerase
MTTNNVDKIYSDSSSIRDFSVSYVNYLKTLLDQLDHDSVVEFVEMMLEARSKGSKIIFIGNGGSAATASHFANDIGYGTRCYDNPFKALSLTDNNAVLTAVGNDDGYDQIFKKQLQVLMENGDVVVAISASGNSPNLLRGIEYTKSKGNKSFGLVGFDGGEMLSLCDSSIHIKTPSGEYGPVEDLHMILDHLVGNYLLRFVKSE